MDVEKELILEDRIMSAQALIADIQNTLTRAALKGGLHRETRTHVEFKVKALLNNVHKIPTRGE